MTLQELCKKYGYSESSVVKQWTRTQEKIYNKYGIKIIKEGRGNKTQYIEEKKDGSDNRALTMYDETRTELILNNESLSLVNSFPTPNKNSKSSLFKCICLAEIATLTFITSPFYFLYIFNFGIVVYVKLSLFSS